MNQEANLEEYAQLRQQIAEQQQVIAELQEREKRFRCIIDHTYDWEYWRGPDGKFLYVSPSCKSITGYDVEDFLADPNLILNIIHPDDHQLVYHCLEAAQMQTAIAPIDFRIITKNGKERWIGHASQPIYDTNNVWLGTRASNRDNTTYHLMDDERKRLEKDLQQANYELNQRIEELCRSEEQLRIFQTIVENAPDGIAVVSPQGMVIQSNAALDNMLGYKNDYVGHHISVVFGGDATIPMQLISHVTNHGFWQGFQTFSRKDGSTVEVYLTIFAIHDRDGQIISFPGIVRDVTEIKQAEEERVALQQQVIEAQRAALHELSAPLLPISEGVVILPLIGSIDTHRAQQIMETLLEGIAHYRARIAIVDITGMAVVDTQVANALIQAAQAVRLLGAQVILTGIGPVMAQTLVHLGVDLSSIITRSTLQSGIAFALKRQKS